MVIVKKNIKEKMYKICEIAKKRKKKEKQKQSCTYIFNAQCSLSVLQMKRKCASEKHFSVFKQYSLIESKDLISLNTLTWRNVGNFFLNVIKAVNNESNLNFEHNYVWRDMKKNEDSHKNAQCRKNYKVFFKLFTSFGLPSPSSPPHSQCFICCLLHWAMCPWEDKDID